MSLLFGSLLIDILAIIITVGLGIITFYKWRYTYWEKRNVPYLQPVFPYGNMQNPFVATKSVGFVIKECYDKLKSQGHKHGGVYNFAAPVYMPVDPEYIKNVMQRDFQHFVDRGIYYNEQADPLSGHLFALGGQKWRHIRTKLTPTFTSGKMKMMFDILVKCSEPLQGAINKSAETGSRIDIKEMVARFTTDIIGSCAFGLDCNSFQDSEPEFRKYGKKIFQLTKIQMLTTFLLFSVPKIGKIFGMRILPKETTDFFFGVIRDTVNYRETNSVVRKDMLQLLLELKNNQTNDDGKPLTIEEVAAQAFVFFAAGFETSSTTMTFCLYELALNPDIQQKVRDEINDVLKKHDNKITYEAIVDLKYMTKVVDETLRKYPPVTQITRKCVMDYKVPHTNITIEKGTNVFLTTLGLHHDPEYYPNPDKFDPERFSEENKKQRHPFTYIPFGEGPRACIGLRFGIMQTKVGLAVLLKNFKFSINKDTEVPLKPDPKSIIYSTKDAVWLNAEKI